MSEHMIDQIAEKVGLEPPEVQAVIDEFLLQLHRSFFEYKGLNGDYIGEELHYEIGRQAFYHFLGVLEVIADKYRWEPGSSSEYLLRLGGRADWLPYRHQTEAWIRQSK